MTPHNEASPGDYAETVLVPGDPLRAKWIAETFLDDCRRVNNVRGAIGFTGFYKGKRVSVQTTGMGRPSFAIYIHELVASYGVRTIIRVGSCGALTASTPLRDIFIAERAVMDFDVAAGDAIGRPDPELARLAVEAARTAAIPFHAGPMVSSDIFYHPEPETRFDLPREKGITAVDMETANLFALSSALGFRAVSICTIVDSLLTGEETALSERQELFRTAAIVALDVATAIG
ncbi:purine-nucleoside phosphorylase [Mesorhizobium sp. LHD-90]|uniref:purine-nucleoside phosphorylase n=1 Tax=Mesorhizobium sp. LHD-90 TaxID=3071414 RepID=UPI0027DED274|nr:purine-nucleoside phosphorylase [Mesorhizobium sp. LHD-90]MDQ6437623.1 purine-nucleoside phosphorylase [Mesorhizobium sp. LHD-90]